jgi:hypothetical protein
MNNYILAGLIILTALACLGCGNSTDFPVARAGGILMHEGQPIANVMVQFSPVRTGDSAIVGARAFGITDADGRFVLATYDARRGDGAIVGKHDVRVYATPETDRNLPASLAPNVLKTVEVVSGRRQTNDFTIELPTRAPRERLVIPEDD